MVSRDNPEQPILPFQSDNAQGRLYVLLDELEKKPNRKDLTWLGKQLGDITRRQPFSYKYLHSVLKGSLEAGWPLRHAIEMAFLRADGVSPLRAEARERVVMSEKEIDGLFVMGNVKTCASETCMVQFVTDHPSRKYCPFCRPPKGESNV